MDVGVEVIVGTLVSVGRPVSDGRAVPVEPAPLGVDVKV